MKQATIRKAFETFLRERSLKLTPQRMRILDRAFETHEHFTAEELYGWLRDEGGSSVSRATVYRTLSMLVDGGFLESLDSGRGELLYEHVMGHRHHDHLLCIDCGKIEEFTDERIEALQNEVCEARGFQLVDHDLRLRGYCRSCALKRKRENKKRPDPLGTAAERERSAGADAGEGKSAQRSLGRGGSAKSAARKSKR